MQGMERTAGKPAVLAFLFEAASGSMYKKVGGYAAKGVGAGFVVHGPTACRGHPNRTGNAGLRTCSHLDKASDKVCDKVYCGVDAAIPSLLPADSCGELSLPDGA